MNFKIKEWDVPVEPTDAEVKFRRELDMYRKVFSAQPIYLVCPQFTYEVEVPIDKVEALLNEGDLKIREVFEQSEFGLSAPFECNEPKFYDEIDKVKEAIYILDGVNAYRSEVPFGSIDNSLESKDITLIPIDDAEEMFQALKRCFQKYCETNQMPYESRANE